MLIASCKRSFGITETQLLQCLAVSDEGGNVCSALDMNVMESIRQVKF